jgi:transposase
MRSIFDSGEKIRDLIESAGGSIQYLPLYSSDLNKIDRYWFAIKKPSQKVKR